MSSEPLDLLGRKLKVGDHVVWQMGLGLLGHGFVTHIEQHSKDKAHWLVTAKKAPGSLKRGQTAHPECFCAIVLPDIQDPEVQLAGEAPPVSALEGGA